MKKIFTFTFMMLCLVGSSMATPWTFYNGSTGWTPVHASPFITINQSNCVINRIPGFGLNHREYYALGANLNNYFVLDFDVTITELPSIIGGAFIPFVCTAGNQAPYLVDNDNRTMTNQDAIGVEMETLRDDNNPNKVMYIHPFIRDGLGDRSSGGANIVIDNFKTNWLNKRLHIRLERYSATRGKLSVYQYIRSNLMLIDAQCFTILETVMALNTLQTANSNQADNSRSISAVLERVLLDTDNPPTPCCTKVITGPQTVCQNSTSIYCVVDNSDEPYTWTVPNGASYHWGSEGTACIIVDWGTLKGDQTITVSWYCNCQLYSDSLLVYVHSDNLSNCVGFRYTLSVENGLVTPIYCQMSCNDTLPPAVMNQWEIFHAFNNDPENLQTTGNPLRPTGYGTDYTITSPEAGYESIYTNQWYVLIHRLSYSDGGCLVDSSHKFLDNKKDGLKSESVTNIIDQPATIKDVKVHPNPASDELMVEIPSGLNLTSIQILNSTGETVMTKYLVNNSLNVTISIRALPAGMYFLKFNGDHAVPNMKLIKQ